ncbi:HAD-IIB family hydrolase [Catenovulum adriaticum]|uniref:HAD-IIB family hydrolase n=1 Tax=Catenovulum adriaticum TaxID=2984846 RepID=A0ABY7ANS9_9ALTE|nr:HAD-IIB family hydrolase [Catenovulum sp. TS8]WAJ70965.1 HAD-IIB family hydrolase [Catenovulum sp. TS8]
MNQTKQPLLIFTDMDGTLLDHNNYSWDAANGALNELAEKQFPVICNTSKTFAEVAQLHQDIGLDCPFIVENGSAIYPPAPKCSNNQESVAHSKNLHQIGSSRQTILQKLSTLRQQGFKFSGFSDWNNEQIIQHTGLNLTQAKQSAQRYYSEPLIWQDTDEQKLKFIQHLQSSGLTALQGGRFLSVQGQCNKGLALNWYKNYYENQIKQKVITVALGDSENDIAMLEAADISIWIKSNKAFPQLQKTTQVYHSSKFGPAGWQETMAHILHLYNTNQLNIQAQ